MLRAITRAFGIKQDIVKQEIVRENGKQMKTLTLKALILYQFTTVLLTLERTQL